MSVTQLDPGTAALLERIAIAMERQVAVWEAMAELLERQTIMMEKINRHILEGFAT